MMEEPRIGQVLKQKSINMNRECIEILIKNRHSENLANF